MSYASDLGLKVGSKIKYLSGGDLNKHDAFAYGEVITLHSDPWENAAPLFENYNGNIEFFDIGKRKWEHYKEYESKAKIRFPCCVPTSEIKEAATLLALVSLFEANGAIVYDGNDFDRVEDWEYFGVSLRNDGHTFRTDFYIYCKHYNQSQIPTDITMYSVAELLGKEVQDADSEDWIEWNGVGTPVIEDDVCELKFRDGTVEIDGDFTVSSWRWGHYNERDIVAYRLHKPAVASQEAITERLEDNPSVGIDLAKEGSEKTVWAYEYKVGDLVKITAHKYGHRFDIGEVVRLTEMVSHTLWIAEKLDGSDWWQINSEEEFTLSKSLIGDVELTQVKEEPLVSITQEVKYTVVIKGTPFTFTQEELDALAEELLGFTTL